MFEVKISESKKVAIKGLAVSDGLIVDGEGMIRDLNKIVLATYDNGDVFDFTINSKNDASDILDEEGE